MSRSATLATVATLFCAFLATGAAPDQTTTPAAQEPWSVEDVIRREEADDFRIAPDCRSIVWVQTAPDENQGTNVSHLMLSRADRPRPVQLTRGTESCTRPRWSPDGERVAF